MPEATILPQDIRSPWLNVARRLQSVARIDNHQGYITISIDILVGADGNPIAWTEPSIHRIEPKRASEEILAALARRC